MHSPLVSHMLDIEFTIEHEHSICLQEREVMVTEVVYAWATYNGLAKDNYAETYFSLYVYVISFFAIRLLKVTFLN